MRAIVLGMPGSGTSYFTGIMRAAGWDVPCPYVSSRRYRTHEILWHREVNMRALRGWRPSRFSPRARVAGGHEILTDARIAIEKADAQCPRWVFKQPESVVTWGKVWSHFRWDLVVGVYRHPSGNIASIRRDHLNPEVHKRVDLKRAWLHWNATILGAASVVVRFPDDGAAFAAHLGLDAETTFKPHLVTNDVDGPVPGWSADRWEELEGARCESTTAART